MIRIHRGNLRTILVLFGILFMSYSAESFNAGILVFSGGLLFHFVSKGFLYRNIELAVKGPYSFFRHPFYFANLLLDIGIILMSGHPVFILVYLVLYYKSYHKVILAEEAGLIDIYGGLYRNYMESVPRYLPKLRPYAKDWYKGFRWENILREREVSRFLRLISYPISFLIIHELIKHRLQQPRITALLLGLGFSILLIWTSYLFHNMVERDRIFKNISSRSINILLLGSLLAVGAILTTVRFAESKSHNLMIPLTLFFCLLGIVLINSDKSWICLIGDCAFLTALCIYSKLFWMLPFSLLAVSSIIIYNFKMKLSGRILFLPVKVRVAFYIAAFIFLAIKEFYGQMV